MNSSKSKNTPMPITTLLGFFLVSFSLIQYEIILTRIFSAKLWYHFSFMAVSLALYGIGAGGLFVYFKIQSLTKEHLHRYIYRASLTFIITLPAIVFILMNIPVDLSFSIQGILLLTLIYVLSAVPFFCGGLIASLLLTYGASQSGRIYAFDLTGAAVGAISLVFILNYLSAPTSLIILSCSVAIAALLFSLNIKEVPVQNIKYFQRRATYSAVIMILSGLLLFAISQFALSIISKIALYFFSNQPRYQSLPKGFDYYYNTFIKPAIAPPIENLWILGIVFISIAMLTFLIWFTNNNERLKYLVQTRHQRKAIIFILLFGILCVYSDKTNMMRIWYAKGDFQFHVIHEGWNSFSRITVTPLMADERSSIRDESIPSFNWGLSDQYKGAFTDQLFMYIDSEAGTPINRFDGDLTKLEFLRWDVTAFGYTIFKPEGIALILGAGGGRDVQTALISDASRVVSIEINPLIIKMMRDDLGEYTNFLYDRNDIEVHVIDGRSYVENSQEKFDLIQVSLIDTWAASASGAYALSENSLYTIEAFDAYVQHLNENGILCFSRWIFSPPKECLRVLALMVEALEHAGISNPEKHIAIVKNKNVATMILKRSPFHETELNKMIATASRMNFEWLSHPSLSIDNPFNSYLYQKNREAFYKTYPFEIRPPTDDRPFFFHMLKFNRLIKHLQSDHSKMFNFQAVYILITLFIITLFLTLCFFIIPVLVKKRTDWLNMQGPKRSAILYFGLLGLGFMLIEIPFLQRFTLFLGHPTYSLTVILFSILLFSGIGSNISQKWIHIESINRLFVSIVVLVLLAFLENIFLDSFFEKFQGVSTLVKILLSIMILAPIGFLLGIPFPTGLRMSSITWPKMVPWVWAINGTTSVMGTVLAVMIAMFLGFKMALYLGGLIYLIAFITATRWIAFVRKHKNPTVV